MFLVGTGYVGTDMTADHIYHFNFHPVTFYTYEIIFGFRIGNAV